MNPGVELMSPIQHHTSTGPLRTVCSDQSWFRRSEKQWLQFCRFNRAQAYDSPVLKHCFTKSRVVNSSKNGALRQFQIWRFKRVCRHGQNLFQPRFAAPITRHKVAPQTSTETLDEKRIDYSCLYYQEVALHTAAFAGLPAPLHSIPRAAISSPYASFSDCSACVGPDTLL
jgi:hypothetical protein